MKFRIYLAAVLLMGAASAGAHEFYVFSAELSEDSVVPPIGGTASGASATVEVRFDGDQHNGGPLAFYSIRLTALDLDGLQTVTTEDDVLAIRFRIGLTNEIGPHALNVFGASGTAFRSDDAELVMNPGLGLVEGVWNNQDESFTGIAGERLEEDSIGVAAVAKDLIEGRVYVEVVTRGQPSGALRGQVLGSQSVKTPRYFPTGDFQLTLVSSSPREVSIDSTTDWSEWKTLTNIAAGVGVVRWVHSGLDGDPMTFYRVTESTVLFPFVLAQPEPAVASPGGSAFFSVEAGGTPPFSAQWFRDGQALSGAGELQLTLVDVNASQAGNYHVVISNLVGSVASETVSLSVDP